MQPITRYTQRNVDAAGIGPFARDQRIEEGAASVDLKQETLDKRPASVDSKQETLDKRPTDEDKREDFTEGTGVAALDDMNVMIEDGAAIDHKTTFEPLAEIAVDHGVANTSAQGIRRTHDTARRKDQRMARLD